MASILYVSSLDPTSPGGIQTLIRNQIRGLEQLGHDVQLLVVPSSVSRSPIDFIPRWRYLRTQDNFPPKEWLRYAYYNHQERLVRQTLRNKEFDLVHVGMIRCYPALRIAANHGLPSVVSTHALELGNRRLAKAALATADGAHCVSQYTKGLVESTEPGIRTRVIPPSIDVSEISSTEGSSEYDGDVVTVGRFVERKNIEKLIEAWAELDDEQLGGRTLHIIGDGPRKSLLEDRAADLDTVRFTGFVSEDEKREALAGSDLFVLAPTQNGFDVEGFGIVWIEAQAAGTTVIGSSHGGAPEAIGPSGCVVDREQDPRALADAITNCLESPPRSGEELQKRAERFDIMPVAQELEAFYQALID